MQWIARMIIRAPKTMIAIIIAITIILGYFIPRITVDNDAMAFIPFMDEERVFARQMETMFGQDDVIYIGMVTEQIFTPANLAKVAELTTLLEEVDGVMKVTSLATVNHIEGTFDGMDVSPLVDRDDLPADLETAQAIRARVEGWEILQGNLVSADGTATSLVVELAADADLPAKERLFGEVKRLIEAHRAPGETYHFAGYVTMNVRLGQYMVEDIQRLLPIAFIVVALTLYFSIRSLNGVLLPLINVGLAVVWTLGLMSILGVPLSMTCTSIPVILVAVGVAYAIHVIHDFYAELASGQEKATALAGCLQKVGLAVMMAGLTTVAGFGALSISKVAPIQHFGVFSAVGTLFALVLALTFVPAVLSLEKIKPVAPQQAVPVRPNIMDRFSKAALQQIGHAVLTHKALALGCGALLVIISIYGALQVYVDDNGIAYVRHGTTLRDDDTMLNRLFGGTDVFNVVLTGPEPDAIKNPQLLQDIADLQRHLQTTFPKIGKTMSLADYIKKMNMAMHENQPEFYALPDPADPESRDLIAQYLLLYSMSGDQGDFDGVVDYAYQQARIVILAKDGSSRHTQRVVDEIYAYTQQHFDPAYQVRVAGGAYMTLVMDRYVIAGTAFSILASLAVVWVLVILSFRSLVGGSLAIIPLTLAVLINAAIMGLLRIPLDIGTSIVSNVAIGAGVDYALHFLIRIQHEMKVQRLTRTAAGIKQAALTAIITTGQAIMYNAVAVAIGFLVLLFSNFTPLTSLGGLVAATMLTTSLGSLIFLPVLLVLLKPKFIGGVTVESATVPKPAVQEAAL